MNGLVQLSACDTITIRVLQGVTLDTNRWNAPVHNGVFRYLIDLLIAEESASRA
jgi:hypothetical protein